MDKQPLIDEQPKEKTIRRLIRDEFKFERRSYIFHTINSINLTLSLFNLISPVNIEGQHSIFFYEETRYLKSSAVGLLNLLAALIVVHMVRIFTCILGYYSLGQKSGHLLTYFMIMSTVCVLARGIISLMIFISYDVIEEVCNTIFQGTAGEDIGSTMTVQYVVLLIFFMVAEIVLALISLIQCSRSKEEYTQAQVHKDKVLRSVQLCFDVAISQVAD